MQFSAILKLISGSPMPVQAGTDLDGDRSDTGDRPSGFPSRWDAANQRWRAAADQRVPSEAWPRPAARRSRALDLDPYRTLDLRFTKSFRAGRRARFDLLVEAFNVTNHVNIVPTAVNHNMNSAAFLERSAAWDARQIQRGGGSV